MKESNIERKHIISTHIYNPTANIHSLALAQMPIAYGMQYFSCRDSFVRTDKSYECAIHVLFVAFFFYLHERGPLGEYLQLTYFSWSNLDRFFLSVSTLMRKYVQKCWI